MQVEVDQVLATHEMVKICKTLEAVEEKGAGDRVQVMGSPSGWGFMEIMGEFVEEAERFDKIR